MSIPRIATEPACPRTLRGVLLALVVFLAAPDALRAERAVAAVCEQVARAVAAESGVPEDVLRSISLTETGRSKDGAFLPWPWTVNMEGIGKWFDSYAEAQAYVDRNVARGARSFDIGCFQINYRWHGEAFASIEEMFDPMANARYAARFLGDLYAEFGDWSRAAGAFHSRTPALARKYATRFDRIRARLSAPLPEPDYEDSYLVADAAPAPARQPAIRQNRYPLLQSGGAPAGLASLVPGAAPSASNRFLPLGGVQPIGLLR